MIKRLTDWLSGVKPVPPIIRQIECCNQPWMLKAFRYKFAEDDHIYNVPGDFILICSVCHRPVCSHDPMTGKVTFAYTSKG